MKQRFGSLKRLTRIGNYLAKLVKREREDPKIIKLEVQRETIQ